MRPSLRLHASSIARAAREASPLQALATPLEPSHGAAERACFHSHCDPSMTSGTRLNAGRQALPRPARVPAGEPLSH